jgi:cytidylate kinase
MAAVTISRQVGSGGDEIAALVAQGLAWRVVGRDLINEAARIAGTPEIALATIDELGLLGVKPSAAAQKHYRVAAEGLMSSLADEGKIIFLGRGGQYALAGRPGVLHVRVIAPLSQRIDQVRRQCSISEAAASATVAATDKSRSGYIRRYYGKDLDDSNAYGLVISTGHLSVSQAAAIICTAARALE